MNRHDCPVSPPPVELSLNGLPPPSAVQHRDSCRLARIALLNSDAACQLAAAFVSDCPASEARNMSAAGENQ
jgi:hypothetical protein